MAGTNIAFDPLRQVQHAMSPTFSTPLRLLLVEDNDHDETLVLEELRRSGFAPEVTRVETAQQFVRALNSGPWDLIISDHSLPNFTGFDALSLFRHTTRDIPFLLVSGTVGEDVAVGAMKAGAQDYLLKDNLARLGPAVERELREARIREERRRAEHALKESEQRYRLLVENSNDLVTELDLSDKIHYASPNHAALTGFSPPELAGRSFFDRTHSDDAPQLRARLQSREALGAYRYQRKDGAWRWFESSGRAFVTDAAQEHRVVVTRDITERIEAEATRKALEGQLRQAQKMEAMGMLAGGIAHDFNNILTGIIGNVELAGLDLPEEHPSRAFLADAFAASNRARDLVSRILLFSRRREQQRSVLSLGSVIKEALRLLRASLPATIEFHTEIDENGHRVLCDPTQIHQVLMNLATNAAHAMRERGGVLSVRMRPVTVEAALAAAHPQLASNAAVCLSIGDTGCGMDATTRQRIFEPFFTTKSAGEGTGLGLAVVHGIMESHDGAITVESEVGRGTVFHLYFPSVETGEDAVVDHPAMPPMGSGQRILLIDDESTVSEIGERMLRKLGYVPLAVTSGGEALKLFEQAPQTFDAVITDLTMPEITGVEIATRVLSLRPEIPVILSTGFMHSLEIDRASSLGVKHFIEKPFTLRSLGENLSAALTTPSVAK
jgi:PAS domain S-box-containing protein